MAKVLLAAVEVARRQLTATCETEAVAVDRVEGGAGGVEQAAGVDGDLPDRLVP